MLKLAIKEYSQLLDNENTTSLRELGNKRKVIETNLEKFDSMWAKYEQDYVLELILIEKEAWKPLIEAIEYEAYINHFE